MPRYYFDLTDEKVIHDLKGKNFPNLREARQLAIAMARELKQTKSTLLREPPSAWSISVKDGRFNKVLSVRVSSPGRVFLPARRRLLRRQLEKVRMKFEVLPDGQLDIQRE
jgi:hypothetical protein